MAAQNYRPTLPKWPTELTGPLENRGIFGVRQVVRRSPRNGRSGTYQILEMASWANVIALTPDRQVVLIEQYRHGIDAITLEIPGGIIDSGETPADAAQRELAEETGYGGESPIFLGSVFPNPAIQVNQCSSYLIKHATEVAAPQPDDGEHIAVHLIPLADIGGLIVDGTISHSLVVAAFAFLNLRPELLRG